uniref:Uncharacterized protein n=1 Tax=Cajanus cajan TaxID=3821 RepID=A0A151R4U3_CAJCA|nr:hypothetical protein KK1_041157 [Cajanus cajan]
MVISVEIHNCIVQKRLVDQGSSADILYCNTFKQLGIPEVELIPYNEPLVGFSGERVQTKGYIKLSTASTLTEPKLETSQSSMWSYTPTRHTIFCSEGLPSTGWARSCQLHT